MIHVDRLIETLHFVESDAECLQSQDSRFDADARRAWSIAASMWPAPASADTSR